MILKNSPINMNRIIIVYAFLIFYTASPVYSLMCYKGLWNCSESILNSFVPVVDCDEDLAINQAKACVGVKVLDSNKNEYIARGCIRLRYIDGDPCSQIKNEIGKKTNRFINDVVDCKPCYVDRCNNPYSEPSCSDAVFGSMGFLTGVPVTVKDLSHEKFDKFGFSYSGLPCCDVLKSFNLSVGLSKPVSVVNTNQCNSSFTIKPNSAAIFIMGTLSTFFKHSILFQKYPMV